MTTAIRASAGSEEYDVRTPPCDESSIWHRPLLWGFLWVLGAHRARTSDNKLNKPPSVDSLEDETEIVGAKPAPPSPGSPMRRATWEPQEKENFQFPSKGIAQDDGSQLYKQDPLRSVDSAGDIDHQLVPKVLRDSVDSDNRSATRHDSGAGGSGNGSPSWGWYSTCSGGSTPSSINTLHYPSQKRV